MVATNAGATAQPAGTAVKKRSNWLVIPLLLLLLIPAGLVVWLTYDQSRKNTESMRASAVVTQETSTQTTTTTTTPVLTTAGAFDSPQDPGNASQEAAADHQETTENTEVSGAMTSMPDMCLVPVNTEVKEERKSYRVPRTETEPCMVPRLFNVKQGTTVEQVESFLRDLNDKNCNANGMPIEKWGTGRLNGKEITWCIQ